MMNLQSFYISFICRLRRADTIMLKTSSSITTGWKTEQNPAPSFLFLIVFPYNIFIITFEKEKLKLFVLMFPLYSNLY